MGQRELLKFFEKNKSKWFTADEIADKISLTVGPVRNSLKKLRQSGNIYFRKRNNKTKTFEYLHR